MINTNSCVTMRIPPEMGGFRRTDRGQPYPVFAAGIFEGTEDKRIAAVVLHVIGQVLPGDVRSAALVWTLDREAWAVILVVL